MNEYGADPRADSRQGKGMSEPPRVSENPVMRMADTGSGDREPDAWQLLGK